MKNIKDLIKFKIMNMTDIERQSMVQRLEEAKWNYCTLRTLLWEVTMKISSGKTSLWVEMTNKEN